MGISKEERAATIGGLLTLVAAITSAIIAGLLGFLGGRSEHLALAQHHASELKRQQEILTTQFSHREKTIILEKWQLEAEKLRSIRNSLIEKKEIDFHNLEGLEYYLNVVLTIESQFDSKNFLRFLRDNGTQKQRERFSKLSREKNEAIVNLQKVVSQCFLSESNKNKSIDRNARTDELVNALNAESKASAAYNGYITSATLKSINQDS